MAKHLLFSQKVVDLVKARFAEPGGDALYMSPECFAKQFDTIVSPTIDEASHLVERVNPDKDVETAIALYEAFPNLNALEASSIGFWTYLTHVDLWAYMRKRFPLAANASEQARRKKIKEKWFIGDPSQSTLMRHPLAGLWWGTRLSVAPERGDGRYDFTRILFRDIDLLTRTLGTYQLGRLPCAIKGILGYVYDHPADFEKEFEAKMRFIMKHFNSIGGVLHLGCLDTQFYVDELEKSKYEWIAAKKKKDDATAITTEEKDV